MELHVQDIYGLRLAGFLESLGHVAVVSGPGTVEITEPRFSGEAEPDVELRICLRVWSTLYPDADVTVAAAAAASS